MTNASVEANNNLASPHKGDETSSPAPPYNSWLWVVTTGAATLILGFGTLALLWFLRRPMAVFFLGLTLASALAPVVKVLKRWLPRKVATILIYVIFTLILIGLSALVVPMLVNQAKQLVDRVPQYAKVAQNWLVRRTGMRDGMLYEQMLSQFTGIASTLAALPVQISSSLVDAFLIIFISFYALLIAPQAHETLLSLFPTERQEKIKEVLEAMIHAMGGYFRGAILTGAIIGSINYIGLLIIGIDFALVLAIIAGIAEFIPFIGPFIAGALIVVISFLQAPSKALFALLFTVILQQVEGNLISPNIMHPQTCISPLATLVVLFAGWSVGGVLGALVAIPLYAGFRVLVARLIFPVIRRRSGAAPRESESAC